MTNKIMIKKLKTNIKKLESKIKYMKLYNIKNIILFSLIKVLSFVEEKHPIMLASVIIFNSYALKQKTPFKVSEIKEPNIVEEIYTSSGVHTKTKENNYNYEHEVLEHSTAWYVNENGNYERIVTTYQINLRKFSEKINDILTMSKEEVDELLIVSNIEIVEKSSLTKEDEMYNEELLIYVNCYEDKENPKIRKETVGEEIIEVISFFLSFYFLSEIFMGIKNIVIKDYVKNKLNILEARYRPMNKKELEYLKKVLEIRKENLELLEAPLNTENNCKKRIKIR